MESVASSFSFCCLATKLVKRYSNQFKSIEKGRRLFLSLLGMRL